MDRSLQIGSHGQVDKQIFIEQSEQVLNIQFNNNNQKSKSFKSQRFILQPNTYPTPTTLCPPRRKSIGRTYCRVSVGAVTLCRLEFGKMSGGPYQAWRRVSMEYLSLSSMGLCGDLSNAGGRGYMVGTCSVPQRRGSKVQLSIYLGV